MEAELRSIVAYAGGRERAATRAADAIRRELKQRWVGIYEVGERDIEIIGWSGGQGLPAHPRFPLTEGLCGAAVAARETIVAADVRLDPRYLEAFGTTRSEIVVPILLDGRVNGLIDVESDRVNAFGEPERSRLERAAAVLSPLWVRS
ncbi:MAG: GAF domain-containing protein [Chloroflexi bacterium]|nr:MAG: GAF domain-containing protein [Chloroflexota bacterium]